MTKRISILKWCHFNKFFKNSIIVILIVKTTSAYKNNKIVYLDSEIWYVATGGFNTTMNMINEVEASVK